MSKKIKFNISTKSRFFDQIDNSSINRASFFLNYGLELYRATHLSWHILLAHNFFFLTNLKNFA